MSSEKRILRLREEGGSDIARRLLASAADDEMPDDRYRKLVEWGAAAAAQADAAATARIARGTSLLKVGGVIALVAASAAIFAYGSSNAPVTRATEPSNSDVVAVAAKPLDVQPKPAPADIPVPAPVVSLDDLPNAPSAVAVSPTNVSASRPSEKVAKKAATDEVSAAGQIKKAATDDVSTAEQMTFIDRARTKLRQGDARGALAILDDYEKRFPSPAFKNEVTVLRVSSLAKSGDRAAAKRIGEAFLNEHPSELYSRRVEAIVRSLEEVGTP